MPSEKRHPTTAGNNDDTKPRERTPPFVMVVVVVVFVAGGIDMYGGGYLSRPCRSLECRAGASLANMHAGWLCCLRNGGLR